MNSNNLAQLEIANLPFSLRMETHGEQELVSRMILQEKEWESFETQLFIKHLKPGDYVLDIGANIGYYTLISSKIVGEQGKVYSFEPEKENFSLLKNNLMLNEIYNAEIFNAGLGQHKATQMLFINEENRGDHRNFNHDAASGISDIYIIKGDDTVPAHIDFIKIDTQGAELAILQGLRKTLKNNQSHLKMIIEFWPYALKQNQRSAEALIKELENYALEVSIIDHINHVLIKSSWNDLRRLVAEELTIENKGFINLWLTPTTNQTSNI
jgi:FkbM family methyltransferase